MKQFSILAILAVFFYSCASNFSSRKHQRLTYIKVQPDNGVQTERTLVQDNHHLVNDKQAVNQINLPLTVEKTSTGSPAQETALIVKTPKNKTITTKEPAFDELSIPEVLPEQPQAKTDLQENKSAAPDSDVMFILQIIFAFLLPPLAVYLKEKVTGRFWLTLILCILSLGGIFWIFYAGGLLWLIAVIIALLVVLDVI